MVVFGQGLVGMNMLAWAGAGTVATMANNDDSNGPLYLLYVALIED
jgi:hypothetical protein